jgi:nitrile hydratase accessory protein
MAAEPQPLTALPHLLLNERAPVFAEPWQAQAFALAVKLSEQGHFTWKEWAAALAHELQAAADCGEPDDGTRYYEHWLAALEHLVTAKGLADPTALITRKAAWTEAYRKTPHGRPVELPHASARPDGRWLLLGLASAVAAYGLVQAMGQPFGGPQAGFAASAGFGTLLGMRHALEPDHLAALSVLLTGERNIRRAAWLGVYWGIGHTLTLLAAGTLLVALRAEMPAMASDVLACAVALMLVGFGFRAIYLSASPLSAGPTHSHVHGASSGSASIGPWTLARRPLFVGAVHGLAGSGALTALVMATIPSMGARLTYLALFGVGSTVGMAALSGLLGWPIARVGTHGAVARSVSLAVGCISIMLGLYWGYPLVGRLF